jgi:hypothetical protein
VHATLSPSLTGEQVSLPVRERERKREIKEEKEGRRERVCERGRK